MVNLRPGDLRSNPSVSPSWKAKNKPLRSQDVPLSPSWPDQSTSTWRKRSTPATRRTCWSRGSCRAGRKAWSRGSAWCTTLTTSYRPCSGKRPFSSTTSNLWRTRLVAMLSAQDVAQTHLSLQRRYSRRDPISSHFTIVYNFRLRTLHSYEMAGFVSKVKLNRQT